MKGMKYLSNYYCNEHPLEKLNLVCISKGCVKRGLICSRCKKDDYVDDNPHIGHQSKIHLDHNVHRKKSNGYEINTQHQFLEKMQAAQTQALFYLKQTVVEISQAIQKVEKRIMEGFDNAKSSIMYRGEILRKFSNMMEKAIVHDVRKEERYEFMNDMRNLVSFIEEKQNGNEYRYQITANPPDILANYIKQNLSLKFKCQKLNQLIQLFAMDQIFNPIQRPSFFNLSKKQKVMIKDDPSVPKQQIEIDSTECKATQKMKIQVDIKNKKNKVNIFAKKMSNALKNMKEISEEAILQKQQQVNNKQGQLQKEVTEKSNKHKKMYQLLQNLVQNPMKIVDQQLFSLIAKNPMIKITKNGRAAKQTQGYFAIVTLNHNLAEKKKISFRISKLKTQIIFGICFVDIVKTYKYLIPSKMAPHGLFGLSSKGTCLHHNGQDNNQPTEYLFDQHDIMNLKYDKGVISFERCGGKKGFKDSWIFQLKTKLEEQDLNKISFFVALNENDNVQIM